jgi:amino acid transporter
MTDQVDLSGEAPEAGSPPEQKYLSVRQAAFIGVGAMVGAGIFALLGAAGAVAGAAVWLSFLIAGIVAASQGYSFAKLGARYPSAGGLLEYVAKGFGNGHVTGVTAWLTYAADVIVTAMVLGILVIFAVVTLANLNPSLLAPSGYPPLRDIVSSVALTFFAFLGFGIITFTAKDLAKPSRQLPGPCSSRSGSRP